MTRSDRSGGRRSGGAGGAVVEASTGRSRGVVDVVRRPVHEAFALAAGRDPWIVAAGVLLLAVPVAAVLSALQRPWVPTGDWALIEMAVRDVGSRHTPLTGVYSRFGWRHPGPLPYYAMAVPYRLVPAGHGLLFAAAVVNLAATVGCVAVVARYARVSALVALAGLTVFVGGLGIGLLADPWNPSITLVPFALFLLLGVEVAVDRARWALPAAAVVGSFVVQAHLGLAVPVAFVAALSTKVVLMSVMVPVAT